MGTGALVFAGQLFKGVGSAERRVVPDRINSRLASELGDSAWDPRHGTFRWTSDVGSAQDSTA